MKSKLFTMMAMIATAAAAHADDDCGLSLSAGNVSLVWSQSFTTQVISFTVTKNKNKPCKFTVTFSKGGASQYDRRLIYGSSRLSYQLYKEASLSTILKEFPDASPHEVISGHFNNGQGLSQNFNYYIQIPYADATTPALKPPGSYRDSFVMKLYGKQEHSDDAPESSVTVNIDTTMPRLVQLSLVASGCGYDPSSTFRSLDFGNLATGTQRSLDMRMLSNAGYSVTFSSQNNGRLAHSNRSVSTTIPYSVTVNGATQNLSSSASSPVVVTTRSGQTDINGTVNPISFIIGTIPDAIAGAYTDNITVTATSTE